MFAIIKTGGKQYRVSEGSLLRVEKLEGEAGNTVTLDHVLVIGEGSSLTVGEPLVKGATVIAEIVNQIRDKKVLIFKKIRRHNYRRKNGHRQELSILKIKEIKTA